MIVLFTRTLVSHLGMCFSSVTISDVMLKSDGIRKRRNEKSEARVAKKRWTKCVRARKEVGVKGKVA